MGICTPFPSPRNPAIGTQFIGVACFCLIGYVRALMPTRLGGRKTVLRHHRSGGLYLRSARPRASVDQSSWHMQLLTAASNPPPRPRPKPNLLAWIDTISRPLWTKIQMRRQIYAMSVRAFGRGNG